MIFRKYRRLLLTVFLIGCLVDGKSVSQAKMSNRIDIEKNSGTTLALPQPTAQAEVSDFLADYRKLRAKKSEAAMRILATVGLVSGVLKVQEAMKINLDNIANEMFNRFNVSTPKENMEKLLLIEETMERDKSSIGVLNSILGFARNAKSFDEIQKDMQTILKEVSLLLLVIVIWSTSICIYHFFLFYFPNYNMLNYNITLRNRMKWQWPNYGIKNQQ